jgi:4-amino-4-deoxy-L-arabinose transferase-like glycosyltransferase
LLVGLIIPIVLFGSYFFIRRETGFSLKDFFIILGISLLISLPWYFYLIANSGKDAFDYIINFHLYQRATVGIEQNAKGTGIFYFLNYLLTIIPFGFLAFYALGKNLKNFYNLDWKLRFVSIWFIICFVLVSLFKTKLESYSFLFLPPACLLISDFVSKLQLSYRREKIGILLLTSLNVLWYFSDSYRVHLKSFLDYSWIHKIEILYLAAIVSLLLFFVFRKMSSRINIKSTLLGVIFLTFVISNAYYLICIPYWENGYKITDLKSVIDSDKNKSVLYVSTNYRHNPQLTFYFNGVDLNWGRQMTGYDFEMLDTKIGNDSVKKNLTGLNNNYFVIVEKDNINRANYSDSKLFIPDNFTFLGRYPGYELYKNF